MSGLLRTLFAFLDLQSTLFGLMIFLCVYWLLSRPRNLPPGPRGFPIIGSLLSFLNPEEMTENLMKLRERYKSDIVHLKMGQMHTIVLFGYDATRQAFKTQGDEFGARPDTLLIRMNESHGLGASSGLLWKEHRRFALSVLRDFGMGKTATENTINKEVFYLLNAIEEKREEPFDITSSLEVAISNVICSISFGSRFESGDKTFQWLMQTFHDDNEALASSVILDYLPIIARFIPGDIFGLHKLKQNMGDINDYLYQRIEENRKSFDEDNITCYIDAYIAEQKSRKEKSSVDDSLFTDKQLVYAIGDLFIAGTETTTTTICWALLYLCLNPDIQRNVQIEVDQVITRGRKPEMSDRNRCVYTTAVLNETQRLCNMAPVGVPHSNLKATKLFGYNIPAGSAVFSCFASILHDPKIWTNPDAFDPNNFLDDEGNLLHRDHLIPFSIGKRACPGESLARMELFLFFTALLQKFTFKLDPNSPKPDLTPSVGIVAKPKPFKIIAIERE